MPPATARRNASRRVSPVAGASLIEWMDIHLPASQPVSNATIHSNAIDCTIGEGIAGLQVALQEIQCCGSTTPSTGEKRKAPHGGAFFSATRARLVAGLNRLVVSGNVPDRESPLAFLRI